MKRLKFAFPALLLLMVVFFACSKYEFRWVRKIEGRWKIANFLVTEIDSSGNVTTLVDEDDCGFYELKEGEIDGLTLEGIFEYNKSYTINGLTYTSQGSGTIDEEGTRIIKFGGSCIACDTVYTIEKNRKNKQVWSRYYVGGNWDKTVKLQMTLERE
ncbi:MAG: hypothetical protein ACK45H_10695 [Bacteroidota bacterium]|jgi:hypothetical protein